MEEKVGAPGSGTAKAGGNSECAHAGWAAVARARQGRAAVGEAVAERFAPIGSGRKRFVDDGSDRLAKPAYRVATTMPGQLSCPHDL